MSRIVSFAAALIIVWFIGCILIYGRSLLIPFVVAIFIWHLLNTMYSYMKKIPRIGERMPNWLRMALTLVLAMLTIKVLAEIITNNVTDVIEASSKYQENLMTILNKMDDFFHIKIMVRLDSFLKSISIQGVITNVYGVFSTVMSSAVLISLYVVFLFVEQHYFRQKLIAIFPQQQHRELVDNILTHIVRDTQTYLGLKTILSLITALSSWVIMKWVGLDFAEFWAVLIFFLNFIPNIGAIIATVFPAVLALIQFDHWLPFFIITSGIVAIQFVIGNFVEPRYLSKSLNLSPLIILFSLALWGTLWGILGMFLSVPITVMMMIVFAHFDKTRPLAIMLSQDGYVQKAYEKLPDAHPL